MFLNTKEKLLKDFQEYLKDTRIPLTIRWEMFEEFGEEILPIHGSVIDNPVPTYDMFDDLFYQRHETINLTDFVIHVSEKAELDSTECNKLMENLLDKGVFGFKFDW
jgi:hypothetical protein